MTIPSEAEMASLSAPQLIVLVQSLTATLQSMQHRLDWFERNLFGTKSERLRVLENDQQLSLGEVLGSLEQEGPAKERQVAGYRRRVGQHDAAAAEDLESVPFFDESCVPVETIELRTPELEGLEVGEFEIIGQKVTHRLAQRPGSYVILKYVRPVVKRRATQTIHCPPAPPGVIEGSRADVSFLAGLLVDKFAWHLPLYRQHQRLEDAGVRVSRPWLTQLVQRVTGLLEPIYDAQFNSIRESRVKAMDESVPRTWGGDALRCCGEDEGWVPRGRLSEGDLKPPTAAVSKRHGGERVGKAAARPRQVCIKEMSVSEPLVDVSKIARCCRNQCHFVPLG